MISARKPKVHGPEPAPGYVAATKAVAGRLGYRIKGRMDQAGKMVAKGTEKCMQGMANGIAE
jgi:hypothetical protein